jgi:NAD(P)-dependent dehydrogenase (short-subunit alcohol dehydrogenase family)
MAVALITGASQGLGKALAQSLAARGWSLVLDARGPSGLARAESEISTFLQGGARIRAIAGDVTDDGHRRALAEAAGELGGLDLLVNNASTLGASPQPRLVDLPTETFRRILDVNTVAPAALIRETAPLLRRSADPRILNITSDASVEHYDSWGGYGSSKTALDHLSATVAVEEEGIRVWAVDPGDMRTAMHQDAFPGEDISDRPEPDTVVPALISLIESDAPSGRIRASALVAATGEAR